MTKPDVSDERLAAFEARMEERSKREEDAVVPEETPEDLQRAYLNRTGRTQMKAGATVVSSNTISIDRRVRVIDCPED